MKRLITMKIIYKVVYYLTIVFSFLILALYLTAPFGGVKTIFYAIEEGFFSKAFGEGWFLHKLGQFLAGLFFLTCVFCILLPVTKYKQGTKYKMGFVFFVILISIALIPKFIAFIINS